MTPGDQTRENPVFNIYIVLLGCIQPLTLVKIARIQTPWIGLFLNRTHCGFSPISLAELWVA